MKEESRSKSMKKQKKTVLIVDDTETILMFEKMMLSRAGYVVITAKNGIEAIEQVEKSKPDIILLDIMMPVMSGLDACKILKENPRTKNIPVIMVTTKGEIDMVEQSFVAGCNEFLTKPIHVNDMLTTLERFVK
jgi:CheY-like chemotaxis protein